MVGLWFQMHHLIGGSIIISILNIKVTINNSILRMILRRAVYLKKKKKHQVM